MKKEKHKNLIYIVLLISIYLLLIVGCRNNDNLKLKIISIINEQINVNIPQDVKLIDKYESPFFMHGRLPKYYVFQFDQEPEDFFFFFYFKKNDNNELEQLIINTLEEENEKYKLKIPEDIIISFDESYLLVYRENNYCLVYYTEDYKLIVFVFSK